MYDAIIIGSGIGSLTTAGLLARAVIILDGDRNVEYVDLVSEITEEPKYKEALDVLRRK